MYLFVSEEVLLVKGFWGFKFGFGDSLLCFSVILDTKPRKMG